MSEAFTLFFDIGGVLLTNAWDTAARDRAVEVFGLDSRDFHTRHGMVKTAFETGRLSLDSYIEKTVFHTRRSFSPDDFKTLMFAQSRVLGETLEWVGDFCKGCQVCIQQCTEEGALVAVPELDFEGGVVRLEKPF